ncbi:hypothetical protein vseg_013812 [Gypsophila vaccaria]
MGTDRRKYVMSVEIAMQRELAYREKLVTAKAEPRGSVSVIVPQNYSLPFQLQSSTIIGTAITTPTPGPFPNPCRPTQVLIPNPRPVPYTGPTPAQARPVRPYIPNLHYPRPTLNSTPLTRPSSRLIFSAHQKRKIPIHHQAKQVHVSSPEDFYCDLCQVDCTSEINLRMHLKGHKHKSMLRNAKAKKVAGAPSEANDKLHCDLCGIWCQDMHAYTLHLNGKNHYLKLRAAQEKSNDLAGASALA